MIEIAHRLGRKVEALRWPENQAVDPVAVERALADNPAVTHVALVHCETTSGLLNPLAAVAAGVAPSLSLDLHDQWRGFETNGQWRFTPPVQVVAALVEALRLLEAEGGPAARGAHYAANFRTLADGMARLGFRLFLDESIQAPIIATFRTPQDPRFRFDTLYAAIAERGFIIYPGKLTQAKSFRIGCIGALEPEDFERLVAAVGEIMAEQGLSAEPTVAAVVEQISR